MYTSAFMGSLIIQRPRSSASGLEIKPTPPPAPTPDGKTGGRYAPPLPPREKESRRGPGPPTLAARDGNNNNDDNNSRASSSLSAYLLGAPIPPLSITSLRIKYSKRPLTIANSATSPHRKLGRGVGRPPFSLGTHGAAQARICRRGDIDGTRP